jgi:hypothetical protein
MFRGFFVLQIRDHRTATRSHVQLNVHVQVQRVGSAYQTTIDLECCGSTTIFNTSAGDTISRGTATDRAPAGRTTLNNDMVLNAWCAVASSHTAGWPQPVRRNVSRSSPSSLSLQRITSSQLEDDQSLATNAGLVRQELLSHSAVAAPVRQDPSDSSTLLSGKPI